MNRERCNIIIKGSTSSGSSAVFDLLREYENINIISGEFDDFRAPGLVEDQLTESSSIDYPNRIDEITRIKSLKLRFVYKVVPKIIWKNEWDNKIFRYLKHKNKIKRLNQIYFLEELNKKLKSDISFEQKLQLSHQWIQSIGNIDSLHKDFALFDQAFNPCSDINIWTKVFKPFKLICVFRNPKDQLADLIKRNALFVPFRSPKMTGTADNIMFIYGRDRKGMVKFLIDAIKKRLELFDYLENVLPPEEILLIDFESLINNYDVSKSVIETFIGDLKYKHNFQKKFFDPDVARNSIDIYRNYLKEEDFNELSELNDWYLKRIENKNINLLPAN